MFRKIPVIISLLLLSNITYAKQNYTFTKMGDIGQVAIPVTAAIISKIKEGDNTGVIQLTKAYLSTIAVTYALKYSANATRPNGGRHSFPSGHAAASFAGAAFLDFRYGHIYGFPAYIASILVGSSRVNANKHHVCDVVGAAVISIVCNYLFTTPYKNNIKVSHTINPKAYALNVEVSL